MGKYLLTESNGTKERRYFLQEEDLKNGTALENFNSLVKKSRVFGQDIDISIKYLTNEEVVAVTAMETIRNGREIPNIDLISYLNGLNTRVSKEYNEAMIRNIGE